MDQQMSDIHSSLKETQIVNKQILKTLNQLPQSGDSCTCNCRVELEETHSEIRKLKNQIGVLDEKKVKQETRYDEFKRQVDDMQKRLEDMQDTLLAAQTNDGKLTKRAQQHPVDIHTSQCSAKPFTFQSSNANVDDTNRTRNDNEPEKKSEIIPVCTQTDGTQDKTGAIKEQVKSLNDTTDLDAEIDDIESGEAMVRKQAEEDDSRCTSPTNKSDCMLPVMTDTHKEYKPNFTTGSKSLTNAGSTCKSTDLPMATPSAVPQIRETSTNVDQTKEKERSPTDPGVFTVICLDISESMAEGDAWSQAKRFITEFLDGLDEMRNRHRHQGLKEEYVSLVTFGHETKLQAIHVTQYDNIRNKIDCMKVGGPTPLNGGIYIAAAAAMSPKSERLMVNGININPRFLVVTDGRITDLAITAGPDVAGPSEIEDTKLSLLREVDDFTSKRGIDIYCVPVGNYDTEFLTLVAGVCECKLIDYQDGRRTARRHYLCTRTVVSSLDAFGLFTGASVTIGDTLGLTKQDQEDIQEIRQSSHSSILKAISSQADESQQYAESSNDKLPVIGTRVRRGPDWEWKNQDSEGPGTVIGHSDNDQQLWVEWDTDAHRNIYKYGFMVGYDVLPVDEPRQLKVGQKIAVGCMVHPGKDGRTTGMKVWDTGVVIKLLTGSSRNENKAQVRWENGKRGDYSYGEDGRLEIELWTQSGATLSGSGTTLSGAVNKNIPPKKQPEKAKKKNKNS